MRLFDSLVTPILTYNAEVWFPTTYCLPEKFHMEDIFNNSISGQCEYEKTHIKFCRQILGVHKKSMILPTLGELGRYPLSIEILGRIITFWIHILDSKENSYLHSLYKDLYDGDENNKWIKLVELVLKRLGMNHVWINQSTLNVKRLKHTVTKKLEDLYELFWKKQKENTSKLGYYNQITEKYELQPYLKIKMNKKYINAMCKLRISAHDLMIERGRYTNIKRQDRLCTYCKEIEDEKHFLDKCVLYNELRDDILKTRMILECADSCNSLSEIMMQKKNGKQIAKFTFEAFQVRSSKVPTNV